MTRRLCTLLLLAAALWLAPASLAAWAASPPAPPAPTNTQVLVHAAEEAFAAGHYTDAVQRYERLAEMFPNHPLLLYNQGTAYARAGQRGMAIWRYLQVLERTPRNRETRENLQILTPGQTTTAPLPIDWLYHHFSLNEWTVIAGTASLLALLFGALYFWLAPAAERYRRLARSLAVPLALLAVLAWPFTLAHYYFEDVIEQAVIVQENTVARTGPGQNNIQTYQIPVGTVVRVAEENGGWVKFSYAGGRMGFVERSRIQYL